MARKEGYSSRNENAQIISDRLNTVEEASERVRAVSRRDDFQNLMGHQIVNAAASTVVLRPEGSVAPRPIEAQPNRPLAA